MALTSRDVMFIMRAQNYASREVQGLARSFGVFRQELEKVNQKLDGRLNRSMERQSRMVGSVRNQTDSIIKPMRAHNRELTTQNATLQRNITQLRTAHNAGALDISQRKEQISSIRGKIAANNQEYARLQALNRAHTEAGKVRTQAFNQRAGIMGQITHQNRLYTQEIQKQQESMRAISGGNTARESTIRQYQNRIAQNRVITAQNNEAIGSAQARSQAEVRAINQQEQAFRRAAQQQAQQQRQIIQMQQQRIQQQFMLGAALVTFGAITAGVGGRIVSSFWEMTRATAELQRGFALASVQAIDLGTNAYELRGIARDVAREIPAAYTEMDRVLFTIFTSTNATLDEAQHMLKGFAMESVAANTDMIAAAKSSIAILNALGYTADELTRVQDVQFQIIRRGVLTYDELSASIGRALPATRRAGQEIETLGAMFTFLTRNGLNARMAATSAARALEAFAHPRTVARLEQMGIAVREQDGSFRDLNSVVQDMAREMRGNEGLLEEVFRIDPAEQRKWLTEARGHLEGLGVQVRDANGHFRGTSEILRDVDRRLSDMSAPDRTKALQDLFAGAGGTIQARRFWDVAIANASEFNRHIEWQLNAKGSMKEAYDIMFAEPAVVVELLTNQVSILKDMIGESLVNAIRPAAQRMMELVQWFQDLDESTRTTIVRVIAINGAVLTLIGTFAALAGMFMIISAAIKGSAVGWIGFSAIAGGIPLLLLAIGTAAYFLVTNWEAVVEVTQRVTDWFSQSENQLLLLLGTMAAAVGVMAVFHAAQTTTSLLAVGMATGLIRIKDAVVALVTWLPRLAMANPIIAGIAIAIGVAVAAFRWFTRESRALKEATEDYSDALSHQNEVILQNADDLTTYGRVTSETLKKEALRRAESEGLLESMDKLSMASHEIVSGMVNENRSRDSVLAGLRNEKQQILDNIQEYTRNSLVRDENVGKMEEQLKAIDDVIEFYNRESRASDEARQANLRRLRAQGELGEAIANYVTWSEKSDEASLKNAHSARIAIAYLYEQAEATGQLTPALEDAMEAFDLLGDEVDDAGNSMQELSDRARELGSVLDSLLSPTSGWNDALEASKDSISEHNDAIDEQISKLGENSEARREDLEAMKRDVDDASVTMGGWISAMQDSEATTREMFGNMSEIIRRGTLEIGEDTHQAIGAILAMGDAGPEAMALLASADADDFLEILRLIRLHAAMTSDEVLNEIDNMMNGIERIFNDFKDMPKEQLDQIWQAGLIVTQRYGDAIEGQTGEMMYEIAETVRGLGPLTVDQIDAMWEASAWLTMNGGDEITYETRQMMLETAAEVRKNRPLTQEQMHLLMSNLLHSATEGGRGVTAGYLHMLGTGSGEIDKILSDWHQTLTGNIQPTLRALGYVGTLPGPQSISFPNRYSQVPLTRSGSWNEGGLIPGRGPDKDTVLAALTQGEFVLRRGAVDNVDLHSLHEFNRTGDPQSLVQAAYNKGGWVTVGDIPKPPSFAGYGTPFTEPPKELGRITYKAAVDWFNSLVPRLGSGVGYQAMMKALQRQFPHARLISGYRPGAITATGRPSYHGQGRAVDTNPDMSMANWIRQHYMNQTRELIYSPMNNRQVHNGRNHYYATPITRAMHWDHIHWAMQNGGVVRRGPARALVGEDGPEVLDLPTGSSVTPLDRDKGLEDKLDELIALLSDREPVTLQVSTKDDPQDFGKKAAVFLRSR